LKSNFGQLQLLGTSLTYAAILIETYKGYCGDFFSETGNSTTTNGCTIHHQYHAWGDFLPKQKL